MKNFSVITYQSESTKLYNHWSEGLTMFIKKDGVNITLNEKEIEELVKSLPRTVGGTY